MRYHSAKVDDNQAEIVKAFRGMGAGVFLVHRLKNFCDIMIVYKGVTVAVEIKDGAKVPSARKLTEGEEKFRDEWESHGGQWALIESIEDAGLLICGIMENITSN